MRKSRQRGSKYGAIPTYVEGIRFASKKEARRYAQLLLLLKAGKIARLELQPAFPVTVNNVKVCTYKADFRYHDHELGKTVVIDVKGFRTPLYKLKRKLVEAIFPGVKITEV